MLLLCGWRSSLPLLLARQPAGGKQREGASTSKSLPRAGGALWLCSAAFRLRRAAGTAKGHTGQSVKKPQTIPHTKVTKRKESRPRPRPLLRPSALLPSAPQDAGLLAAGAGAAAGLAAQAQLAARVRALEGVRAQQEQQLAVLRWEGREGGFHLISSNFHLI